MNEFTKIINKRNNMSFCVYQNELLRNCSEAINNTKDGIEKYDCIKCIDNNKLVYNYENNIKYCQYFQIIQKCMVKYCKNCEYGNNYFCNKCMSSNYEVDRLTGQCVEKTEQVPDIIWKDIFRLELNGYNQKNGILYTGPYFRLKGITNSQINSKHAFLIYLSLKIKTTLRNLENDEDIILQSICEIKNGVEESTDDINIVEYECFSNNTNNTNLTNYELNEIEEGENEGLLKKSNINELLKNTGLDNMLNDKPNFQLQDLMKYIIFELDNIKNQTSENYIFNFQIEGKLNKEINNENIDIDLELNEIEDKINCKFIVENNITGILNCLLDINNYKNKTYFTFKASEIKTEKNNTIYFSKLNEIWLINYIEDEIYKENTDKMRK